MNSKLADYVFIVIGATVVLQALTRRTFLNTGEVGDDTEQGLIPRWYQRVLLATAGLLVASWGAYRLWVSG